MPTNSLEKMRRKALIYLSAIAILIILVTGCKTSRNAAVDNSQKATWTTLYAPVSLTVDKPMSMGVTGRMTMEKDRYIHLSMRFIGMEVAVLYLNQDSVFFADKYHKYLFAEPKEVILGEKYKDMTIGEIQELSLGQKKITNTDLITITPSRYVETPAGWVATSMSVNAETPELTLEGVVDWDEMTAKWNEPDRTATWKTPSNYRRVTADNLKTILNSLSF